MKLFLVSPRMIDPSVPDGALSSYQVIEDAFDRYASDIRSETAEDAEFLLLPVRGDFLGTTYGKIREHPLYRKHRHKFFVYACDDLQFPFIRGLYPGADRVYVERGLALPAAYYANYLLDHGFNDEEVNTAERTLLFSFVGSFMTNPIRRRLSQLTSMEPFVIEDTAQSGYWWEADRENKIGRYRRILLSSRYILCPAGVAPSSIRIFEALEAGCVPVIISDRICLPFSEEIADAILTVPEKALTDVPRLVLEHYRARYRNPSYYRKIYAGYFAPDVVPRRFNEELSLLAQRSVGRVDFLKAFGRYLFWGGGARIFYRMYRKKLVDAALRQRLVYPFGKSN